VAQPLVSPEAKLEIVPVADTYLYDVPTVAGKTYIFTAE
jgi:alpha-L-fucosidase 2